MKKRKVQDRAIETRNRLMEATFEILVEKGYASTTTREVCRRLNVSKGTLQHHFATREEFIIAAIEYVLEKNINNFQQTLAEMPMEKSSLRDMVRVLWEKHWANDIFYAWLELVNASRTDEVLNEKVKATAKQSMEKYLDVFKSMFGMEPTGILDLFFLMLSALSLEKIFADEKRVNHLLEDLLLCVEMADRFFFNINK
ncbi:MAG: TetR/AcrR family transcriptional regulator [Bacteroidetes bacterium]|nr:TetR/AcrR family transcriptional regulator [Bacteroidota bacterium]